MLRPSSTTPLFAPCHLQSNVAIEYPRAFPTTVGFHIQGGFELSVQHAPTSTAVPVDAPAVSSVSSFLTPSQQLPKLSSITPGSAERSSGVQSGWLLRRNVGPSLAPLGCSLASSVPMHKDVGVASELVSAFSSGLPESPTPVGWKGLLEFSETSGCSGVLGQKTAVSEVASHMEA